jgi:hypothetical protein
VSYVPQFIELITDFLTNIIAVADAKGRPRRQ